LRYLLFLFVFVSSTASAAQWIVVRRDSRARWDFPTSFKIRFLDRDERFVLVESPRRPKLGEGFHVQPNYRYSASAADPDLAKSWGLINNGQTLPDTGAGIAGVDIGAPAAWTASANAQPVTVAILDSGAALTHPDLVSQLWRNGGEIAGNGIDDDGNGFIDDIHGWNLLKPGQSPLDDNGHGTFCAGIIGAAPENGVGTRGVAPRARLMIVKMLDERGQGTSADAISAIDYAVRNGVSLLNASWGGTQFDPALYESVRRAGDRGVLFIAAAGNDGRNNDNDSKPIYPASFRLPNIVSVAAYDQRDKLAKFSNYGKETVQLGAPGVSIYSTDREGFRYGEGTSFAAPFVTGVAALVLGTAPGLTLPSLRDRLLWTSEPIHYYEKEKTQTGGRLHAGNAVRDYRPARPKPPSSWLSFGSNSSTLHPYANKTSEIFRFTQVGAKHVRVHFKKFETESCCDKVVLKDGVGNFITEYRGNLGDFWSADALGDTLLVEFTSDFSMPAYGFDIDSYEISN